MMVEGLMAELERASPEARVWIHEPDPHFGTPKLHKDGGVVHLDNGDVVLSAEPTLALMDRAEMGKIAERSNGDGCKEDTQETG